MEDFITQAKQAGYTDEQINLYLEEKKTKINSSTPDISPYLQSKPIETNKVLDDNNFISEAKKAGYSYDQIQSYLANKKSVVEQNPDAVRTNKSVREEVENATDLAAAYTNIHSRWSTLGKMAVGAVFDEDQMTSAMQDINNLNNGLVKKLRSKGVNAYIDSDTNSLMMQSKDGNPHEIEPGMLSGILSSKFETGGALAGAIAGAKYGAKTGAALALTAGQLGAQVALPEELITVPVASAVGGAIGAFGGGVVGAFTGSGIDYLANSIKLKDDLDAKVALSKMTDAGIADATMTILAGGAWKIAKPIGSKSVKLIGRAFDVFKNGNQKGAYEILLKDQNITKEQADDIVTKWKKISATKEIPQVTNSLGITRPMTKEELAIKVITETRPGGEAVISASEGSSIPLSHSINERAKDVIDTVNRLAPGQPAKEIRNALQDYQIEVGKYYETVKNIASSTIDRTSYRFDIDKLAIKPAMLEASKHLDNPYEIEKFSNVMNRIDDVTSTRTFSDLIDLRQSVNAIKARVVRRNAQESLKKSIMSIDREIQRATDEYLPSGQAKLWRQEFRKSKLAYSQMKQLEDNILFNSITDKKGITEDQIIKKLSDLAPALDDTFVAVMRKLPKGLKDKTEAAVIKMLTERYTVGLPSELQAIHFPELANKLSKYNLQSPAARQYVDMINEFAEVFRNDVQLSRTIGGITIPKFQSYLTTDPVMRAKYELASGVFGYVKQLLPGVKSDRIALVKMVGNMLDNPLKAKQSKEFIKAFPEDKRFEIEQLTNNLKQSWVEAGLNSPEAKESIKLYKATTGSKITKTSGGFGSGYYLREFLQSPNETRNVIRRDFDPRELATIEDINSVYGLKRNISIEEVRKLKSLPSKLKKYGFKGITHDGRVMLFDDPN